MTMSFMAVNYLSAATTFTLVDFAGVATFRQSAALLTHQVSSQRGHAILETQGAYTGLRETTYYLQVNAVNSTGDFGSGTTWQWSTDQVTWTNGGTATAGTWVPLNQGVQVRWMLGTSTPQFVLGDATNFRATCPEGVASLTDVTRNTMFRSQTVQAGMGAAIVADLVTAKSPAACILMDHNLIAGTTLQLRGSDSSNFTTYDTYTITYAADRVCAFPTVTPARRYWAIRFGVQAGQPPIALSEWYLGERLAVEEADIGLERGDMPLGGSQSPEWLRYGPGVGVPYGEYWRLTLGRRHLNGGGTGDQLRTLWRGLNSWQTGDLIPVFVTMHDATPNSVGLYHWTNPFSARHRALDIYDIATELQELVRSVA